MRIRSTKPEFWRSERIASVDWDARLVLKGIESYVDDNGVGKDDLALIVADVFPRDLSRNPTGTLQKVSEALSTLSDAGLLWRYSDGETNLLYVAFWESIQRIEKPSKGRFRRPDGTLDYRQSEIGASFPEPSRNTPGTLRPGTGEQGNRGTEDQGTGEQEKPVAHSRSEIAAADLDCFDEFWAVYDHKVGRKKAETAYRAALKKPGITADLLIAAAASYIEWQRSEGKHPKFTKHPATWLHGEHWTDERAGRTPPLTRVQEHLSLVEQLAAEEADSPAPIAEIGYRR